MLQKQLARFWKTEYIALILIIGFLLFANLLRWSNVTPYFNVYDSPGYFKFSLWKSYRGAFVSIPYSVIQDWKLVTLFQNLVSAVVWSVSIFRLSRCIRNWTLAITFGLFLIVLAQSSPVYEHNNVLMSESLAISSLVFLVTSLIIFEIKQSKNSFYVLVFAMIWFANTKQSYALLAPILALYFTIKLVRSNEEIDKRRKLALIACWVSVAYAFFLAFSTKNVSDYNFVALIYYRFSVNSDWLDWWVQNNFPIDFLQEKDFGKAYSTGILNGWLSATSNFKLILFYLSHPLLTLFGAFLLPLFSANFTWGETASGAIGIGTRYSRDLFLEPTPHLYFFWWDNFNLAFRGFVISIVIIWLFSIAHSLHFRKIFFRFNKDTQSNFPKFLLKIILFHLILIQVIFLLGPADLLRLFIAPAISLRVILIFVLFLLIDEMTDIVKRRKR